MLLTCYSNCAIISLSKHEFHVVKINRSCLQSEKHVTSIYWFLSTLSIKMEVPHKIEENCPDSDPRPYFKTNINIETIKERMK